MSILNAFISPKRVRVMVDTFAASSAIGQNSHMSKLLALPHSGVVVGARGQQMLFSWIFSDMHMSMAEDYDAVVQKLPSILSTVTDRFFDLCRAKGIDTWGGLELVVAGWSNAADRMLGIRFERWPTDSSFKAVPIESHSLGPNVQLPDRHDLPNSVAQMTALAKEQVNTLKAMIPGAAVGGRLLLAEAARDSMSIRTIADLEATA
jgi:hypothetical protein